MTWDLSGNVVSATTLSNGVTVNPTTSADGSGNIIFNAGAVAYLVVPFPAAPTRVTAVQTDDQFQVSWTPAGQIGPPRSSTVTATPVNSTALVLTTTVTGQATNGVLSSLQPQRRIKSLS